jgi:hypothetical protein
MNRTLRILKPLIKKYEHSIINNNYNNYSINNINHLIYIKEKKMSTDDYAKIIKETVNYGKYETADIFDFIISNCEKTENEETKRIVYKYIAERNYYSVFRIMWKKPKILCEEIIKLKPNLISEIPQNLHTEKLRDILFEVSGGKYFCFVNPELQTYEYVLKNIKSDGCNLQYVKKEFIDDNLITEALKSNGEAIKFVVNPTKQNYIDAIMSKPSSILYIKDMTPELYMLAVHTEPMVLQYIKKENQTEEMCLYALTNCKNSSIITYVRITTPKIWNIIMRVKE